ncbi:MAG TPA: hypothetical protein DCL60_03640 [Armatimonadetes bacterium]|nr:hypothetical protein [Armatimonadota bacterium]
MADVWINPIARKAILDKYNLNKKEDLRLMSYMLFEGAPDEFDKEIIVLWRGVLRKIYGRKATIKTTLQEFRERTGLDFDVYKHNRHKHRATTVRIHLDEEIEAIIFDACLDYGDKSGKVGFVTGDPYTKYRERKEQKKREQELAYSEPPMDHPGRDLILYLHSRDSRRILQRLLRKNKPNVKAALLNMAEGNRRYMAATRWAVSQRGLIKYKGVANTSRIYGDGANIFQLPKAVREAALVGTYSLDMKSAQLVIVSRLWQPPLLMEEINKGTDMWRKLVEDCFGKVAEEDFDRYKGYIKGAVYTIIFGGGKDRIKIENPNCPESFMKHPIIEELLEYRKAAMDRIKEHGGIRDAFGEWWTFEDVENKDREDEKIRSLLSREVQSYELAIMLEGFKALGMDRDLVMVAWLHDGVYIYIRNHKANADHKLYGIAQAIEAKASTYGMPMRVECEYLE